MQMRRSSKVSLLAVFLVSGPPSLAQQEGPSYARLHEDARRLVKDGKAKEALPLELKAAELQPAEPATHETLSTIYARLGDYTRAVKEARRVVELQPRDGLAHYNLALSLQQLGHHGEALSEYRRGIALGDKGVDAQIGEAQSLLALGQITESIRKLETLSQRFPQTKEVWLNLAHAYIAYEDRRGAVLAADTALRLDPNYKEAIRFRSLLALSGNRFRTALTLARRLIQIEPTNPEGYRLAAKIAAQTRWSDINEAQWVFDHALENIPTSADTFRMLGASCQRVADLPRHHDYPLSPELKRKWYRLSEAALTQAVKVAPDQAATNLALAQFLVQTRRPHAALPYARRALELSPQSVEAQTTYQKARKSKNDLAGQLREWLRSLI